MGQRSGLCARSALPRWLHMNLTSNAATRPRPHSVVVAGAPQRNSTLRFTSQPPEAV
jgi:hypothetical protein